eukprot:8672105-Lingulodinium_polyedra.AAC.1
MQFVRVVLVVRREAKNLYGAARSFDVRRTVAGLFQAAESSPEGDAVLHSASDVFAGFAFRDAQRVGEP